MTLEISLSQEPQEFLDENSLWDIVLSSSGKPRLKQARSFFNPLAKKDISVLVEAFKYWRDYSEYLILKAENVQSGEKKYFAVKCSKRGNDIFSKRLDRSLGFLKTSQVFFDPHKFEEHKQVKTRLLWVTLTYDSKRRSLNDAWINLVKEFNLWITNLRNKYGSIFYVAFPQAFPDPEGKAFGYPHLHIIMFFEDIEFNVFRRLEKDRSGNLGLVYRIEEKHEIETQGKWHSFIDVKALSSMRSVWNYAKKHAFNAGYGDSREATLNNSVMWLYRKRSFNMSGEFRNRYTEFIKTMRNSKTSLQETLDGSCFSVWKYTFLGVFSSVELEIDEDPPPWVFSLDKDRVDSLVDSRFSMY